MQREILKLQPNVPTIVTLNNPHGFESRGRFGTDYRFDISTERGAATVYLPSQGAIALQRSGAQEGDQIEILKRKHPGSEAIDWRIRIYNAPPQSYGELAVQRQPAPLAAPAPREEPRQPAAALGTEEILRRCLICAIDAASAAEQHAKAKSFPLEFTSEDVRAMGLSIYIAKTRDAQNGRAA